MKENILKAYKIREAMHWIGYLNVLSWYLGRVCYKPNEAEWYDALSHNIVEQKLDKHFLEFARMAKEKFGELKPAEQRKLSVALHYKTQ